MATSSSKLVDQLLATGERAQASGPLVGEEERRGVLWTKLRAHVEQRIEMLRKRNDKYKNEIETTRLRGRIEELKYLLTLDTSAPVMEADESKD